MWQCPKCNREFKNVDQSHYCGKPESIDDYFATQSPDIQVILKQLYEIIKLAIPTAEETIKWGMPYFTINGENLCGFAAQKKHISFFPGEDTVAEFETRLKDYKAAKGTIQLPYDKPIDSDLITEMLNFKSYNISHKS